MEKLVDMGLVKSIGISNFTIKKVTDLLEYARIKPVCNQGKIYLYVFSIFNVLMQINRLHVSIL